MSRTTLARAPLTDGVGHLDGDDHLKLAGAYGRAGVCLGLRGEEIEEDRGLAGGVFVGREQEMDELRAGLEDALSGRGRRSPSASPPAAASRSSGITSS